MFGQTVQVTEMQSEAGAAGTVHGSLAAGALTTTYTASQGLLLMIPNLYKVAGEQTSGRIQRFRTCTCKPCTFHLRRSFRCICLSSDRSMHALRVQRAGSNGPDSGCSSLPQSRARLPFINFFDGFRTSHEIQKIETWDYEDLKEMADIRCNPGIREISV